MLTSLLAKVSVLFILLFIGGLVRYKKILSEDSTRSLAAVVLFVTLPLLYFESLASNLTIGLLKTIWVLPVFAVVMVLTGYLVSSMLSALIGLKADKKATFVYLATFTNCGFLAIPLASAIYGAEGVTRVVLFNVGFNILYWTLGVSTLKSSDNKNANPPLKNLINTGTIGLFLGIIVGLCGIRVPRPISDAAKILGSATIPLALLVVGSLMSEGDLRKVATYKRAVSLIVLCKLIIMPLIMIYITGFFRMMPLDRAIIVLQAAMPSASTTPIFTSRFGGDTELASAGVFITTVCSLITIPALLYLL